MAIRTNVNQDEAMVRFYCSMCRVWHIDSDQEPAWVCYYCDRPLCPLSDYACVSCSREVCDNCRQACQKDDCYFITCRNCVDQHLQSYHPIASAGMVFGRLADNSAGADALGMKDI